MILRPKQLERFFVLLDSLSTYANDSLDILGHPFDMGEGNENYSDELRLILDRVWSDGSIIDRFIAENPYGLSDKGLLAVADWKQVLQRRFMLVNHENGYSNFMIDGKVYAVIGLSKELSSIVPRTPRAVNTVLLPFDGSIVYDSQIEELPLEFLPNMITGIEDEYRSCKERGEVYRSSQAFIRNAAYHREEKHQHELNGMIDAYRQEKRLTKPEDDMPKGMHKGRLAGCSPEERDALIEDGMDGLIDTSMSYDEAFTTIFNKLPKGPARYDMEASCNLLTKDMLVDVAKLEGIPYAYKLKKSELIGKIVQSGAIYKPLLTEEFLRADDIELSLLLELIALGGTLVSKASDFRADVLLANRPPLICSYRDGDIITTITPQGFLDAFHQLDTDALMDQRKRIQRIHDCAGAFVGLYGIISLGEFWELYKDYFADDGLDFHTLLVELMEGAANLAFPATLWLDHETEALYREQEGDRSSDGVVMRALYLLDLSLMEHDGIDDRDDNQDWDEQDSSDAEEHEAIAERRRFLIERHKDIPRKTITQDELECFSIFDYCYAIPELQRLRAFFDSYVPDNRADLFFADEILDQIIMYVQAGASIQQIFDFLTEEGFNFESEDFINDFMVIFKDAYNAIPRWENNGHSPVGMRKIQKT